MHGHQHGDARARDRRDLVAVQEMSMDHVGMEVASQHPSRRRSSDGVQRRRRDVDGSR